MKPGWLLSSLALLLLVPLRCPALEVGDRAPDFKLMAVSGIETTIAALRGGNSLLLDFGSVFCVNCQGALSLLADIARECKGGELTVAAINVDPPNSAKAVKAAIHGLDPGYEVLLDGDGAVAAAYGVTQIPHLVLIDARGVVAAIHTGQLSQVRRLVETLCAPSGKEE